MVEGEGQLLKVRVRFILLLLLAGALALSACSGQPATAPSEPGEGEESRDSGVLPQPATPIDELEEETPPPAFRAPLSGAATEQPLDERIVGVMIDNLRPARPQAGLAEADWVFELLAEGDVTRFTALFQSQSPAVIGPVRSIRPYFIELFEGVDAVVTHAGGSTEALNILRQQRYPDLDGLSNAGRYFWRDKSRRAPHNLYTSMEKLRQAMEKKGYAKPAGFVPSWSFYDEANPQIAGESGREVHLSYYNSYPVDYVYDESRQAYLRITDGEAHLDPATQIQLGVRNLIVFDVFHQLTPNDIKGRRSVELTGSGSGFLFQLGKVNPIQWQRKEGEFFAFYAADGQPIRLLPGNTWVQILPSSPPIADSLRYQ